MADYNESSITGTAYQRCYRMVIDNPLGGAPVVTCREERITNLADGTQSRLPIGPDIMEPVTPANLDEPFELRNPATGESVGIYTTYQELYIALYSAYWHLALKRDGVIPPYVAPAPEPESEPELI